MDATAHNSYFYYGLKSKVMKKLYIGLFFAAVTLGAYAQASLGIGGGRQFYGLQDTVSMNDTDSYYVWIKNTGNSNFSGIITVITDVDSTGTGSTLLQVDSVSFSAQLAPGDSIPFTRTENYLFPGNYRMGGNIVVIWPSSMTAPTTDSTVFQTVFVVGGNMIAEISDDKNIRIFPNPSHGNVSILSKGHENDVRSIKLMDVSGRELITYRNTNMVSLEDYADGIYFLEVTFSDKSQKTFKIIRKQ